MGLFGIKSIKELKMDVQYEIDQRKLNRERIREEIVEQLYNPWMYSFKKVIWEDPMINKFWYGDARSCIVITHWMSRFLAREIRIRNYCKSYFNDIYDIKIYYTECLKYYDRDVFTSCVATADEKKIVAKDTYSGREFDLFGVCSKFAIPENSGSHKALIIDLYTNTTKWGYGGDFVKRKIHYNIPSTMSDKEEKEYSKKIFYSERRRYT